MEINPNVTLKATPQEDCVVVARFPEVSEVQAVALNEHMSSELASAEGYKGIHSLSEEERAREMGGTAVKVLFGGTYLAAAEHHTSLAAHKAGRKVGVPVVGFLLQPTDLMRNLGNWADSQALVH